MLSAREKPLQWQSAVSALAAMRWLGPQPDVVTGRHCMSACTGNVSLYCFTTNITGIDCLWTPLAAFTQPSFSSPAKKQQGEAEIRGRFIEASGSQILTPAAWQREHCSKVSYSAVLSAGEKSEKWVRVLQLFGDMRGPATHGDSLEPRKPDSGSMRDRSELWKLRPCLHPPGTGLLRWSHQCLCQEGS